MRLGNMLPESPYYRKYKQSQLICSYKTPRNQTYNWKISVNFKLWCAIFCKKVSDGLRKQSNLYVKKLEMALIEDKSEKDV